MQITIPTYSSYHRLLAGLFLFRFRFNPFPSPRRITHLTSLIDIKMVFPTANDDTSREVEEESYTDNKTTKDHPFVIMHRTLERSTIFEIG